LESDERVDDLERVDSSSETYFVLVIKKEQKAPPKNG
jgi:hypothetical protein